MSATGFPPSFPLQPFSSAPVYATLNSRLQVMIAGQVCDSVLSYEVTRQSHGAADFATVTLPISGQPDWSKIVKQEVGESPVGIEIYCDLNNSGTFAGRFAGIVDQYTADPLRDIVTFTCRNMCAPLTTGKTTVPFDPSVTTVAFVEAQAARFGLETSVVLGPDQQPARMIDVLGAEFVTGVRNYTIWSLLLQAAQYDDVDLWADRFGVLHYESPAAQQRNPLTYTWGSNIIDIVPAHSPQFSRNVLVEVHSYQKRTRTSSVSRATSIPGGGMQTTTSSRTVTGSPVFGGTSYTTTSYAPNGTKTTTTSTISGGPTTGTASERWAAQTGVQKYTFFVRNKSVQQCDDLAQRIWRQVSQHEYSIKLTVPMTLDAIDVMDVTCCIGIEGSPYAEVNIPTSAGGYWPREINERVDTEGGAVWTIDATSFQLPQDAAFDGI